MFQNLRENNQIYILHKDASPYLEIGSVVRVTAPIPKFPIPQTFGQPQEMIVDMVVRVNGNEVTLQKLPASAEVASTTMGGNVTIAASRDAMNAEVSAMKQKSIDHLSSIDYHRGVVDGCDKLLLQLNPEFAEKQRQQEEINELKTQMGEMARTMTALMDTIKQQTLGSETESSSKKKE